MIALPSDLEIAQHLVPVQAAVMAATRTVRSPRRSTRFRVTRNLIIAGAAIAALTAGAWIVAQREPAYIANNVSCFEHASLDSRMQPINAGGDSTDDHADPIAACSFIWSEGFFLPGGPKGHDNPVPDLTACTLADGSAGVFPREGRPAQDFCAALGLAVWDSD